MTTSPSHQPGSAQEPGSPAGEHGVVLRRAGVVGAATLLSRVLGLVRSVICARLFGARWYWDAFVLAFMLPNLMRKLFGEGALSAAFVPVFTERLERDGPRDAGRALGAVGGWLVLAMGGLSAAVAATALAMPARWLALAGKDAAWSEFFLPLVALLFPFVVFICLSALLQGALNSMGRFLVPALGPVLLNCFWIGGALLSPALGGARPTDQVRVVAGAIIAGVAAQTAMLWVSLARAGIPFRPSLTGGGEVLRRIGARMLPAVFGAAVYQVNVLLDNVIATAVVPGEGAVAVLSYSSLLMQLPMGLVAGAIATALLPHLSRLSARGQSARIGPAVGDALSSAMFLVVPASAGLVLVRGPLAQLLYQGGAFTAEDTARTARALMFYGAGIWAVSLARILRSGFYAVGDMKTPVRVGVVGVGMNLVLNLLLARTELREAGLALATTVSAVFTVAGMTVLFHRRVGSVDPRRVAGGALRSVLASACMYAGALGADVLATSSGAFSRLDGRTLAGARTALLVAGGAALYFLVMALLKDRRYRRFLRRGRNDEEGAD